MLKGRRLPLGSRRRVSMFRGAVCPLKQTSGMTAKITLMPPSGQFGTLRSFCRRSRTHVPADLQWVHQSHEGILRRQSGWPGAVERAARAGGLAQREAENPQSTVAGREVKAMTMTHCPRCFGRFSAGLSSLAVYWLYMGAELWARKPQLGR